jgi:Dna[CI] antecedent, DciA
MRGRRRTLASVIAESLASRGATEPATIAAAFAEACGPRLAREVSCRGVTREGRLLVVARTPAWASQVEALGGTLCDRVNARVGRKVAQGLDVHIASDR